MSLIKQGWEKLNIEIQPILSLIELKYLRSIEGAISVNKINIKYSRNMISFYEYDPKLLVTKDM